MHGNSHASEDAGISLQFCLVQVTDNAREVWDKDESKSALRKRVSFVGGDFFKKGARLAAVLCADVCIMRHARRRARAPQAFVSLLQGPFVAAKLCRGS